MKQLENDLVSIKSYSEKKAKMLLLKINLLGGLGLLFVFGYLVANHYQTKLNYLFSSFDESIGQAIVRGDQHILNNLARSINQAEDVSGVWITENKTNGVVGFYSKDLERDSLSLMQKRVSLNGTSVQTLISRDVSASGLGMVGTIHLMVQIPALKLLFLGTLLFGIFIFISLSILKAFGKLSDSLSNPIVDLSDRVRNTEVKGILNLSSFNHQFNEIHSVAESFESLIRKKEESEKVAQDALRDAVKGRIASVVVHDVRQRLHNAFAMLESLKRKFGAQKELSILHSALLSVDQTIVDIPKVDLSSVSGSLKKVISELGVLSNADMQSYPVVALIEPVAKEYRTKAEIEGRNIRIEVQYSDFSLKINVDAVKFQRVMSNLFSNSFKAIRDSGQIKILIGRKNGKISIELSDTGCGCSKEMLHKLGTLGFSTFKKDSSGTGLASCIAAVQSWNGKMLFQSDKGVGFVATIELPESKIGAIYVDSISLTGKEEMIIVDDDTSVHKRWNDRLKRRDGTLVKSFKRAEDFMTWASSIKTWENKILLFDLYLGSNSEDGITLASRIPQASSSVLVTNNWFDAETMKRCKKQNLKVLSKDLVEMVPIV